MGFVACSQRLLFFLLQCLVILNTKIQTTPAQQYIKADCGLAKILSPAVGFKTVPVNFPVIKVTKNCPDCGNKNSYRQHAKQHFPGFPVPDSLKGITQRNSQQPASISIQRYNYPVGAAHFLK